MNLTLKDIAQALGISITTVSKVLKYYKDVNPQIRAWVRAYAEQMNFRPNAQASFSRTQKMGLLGLVVPHYRHDFFNTILETLITQADQYDYRLVVLCSEESYENEKK
ncbi:LacI family DNA-binding transcriptional regulator [Flavobacteriaceae bacterium]|nr:LacI family DNA-binding transcriptional regulator [Flavobacteriaceae bacterium]